MAPTHPPLPPRVRELVAARFKVLAEPARLHLLDTLRNAEMTVNDLVQATRMGQANVSRHLQLLHTHGFVQRRREGAYTWYRVAGRDVFRLCDIMCGRLDTEATARKKLLVRD